jgi:hypothetical protein
MAVVDSVREAQTRPEFVDELVGQIYEARGPLTEPEIPRNSWAQLSETKVSFDLIPRDWLAMRRPHFFASGFGRTNVCHVLTQLDQSIQIIGVDDRSNAVAVTRKIHRLVVGLRARHNRTELTARI